MSKPTQRFTIRFPDGREIRHFEEALAQETAQHAEDSGLTFECLVEDLPQT